MIEWKNMDTLSAYKDLQKTERIDLKSELSGENGANRVKNYTIPMGAELDFNYGAFRRDCECCW